MATGRGPVTSGLGAEDAGLRMDRGYIRVDEQYRTSVPGVSAVGDVITFEKPGHPQLAHLSSAEGIVVAERIAGQEFRPINYDRLVLTTCTPLFSAAKRLIVSGRLESSVPLGPAVGDPFPKAL